MVFSIREGTAQKATFGLAVLSTATQTALAAIITRLATVTPKSNSLFGATIAAVVFDFIVLIILAGIVVFAIVARSSTSRTIQLGLSATSFVLFITASILSIYVLGWTWANIDSVDNSRTTTTHGPVLAGFVIWTFNMVAQTTLHIFRSLRKREQTPSVQTEPVAERQMTPRSIKRSLSIPLKSLSPSSSPFGRSTFEANSPALSDHRSTSAHSSTIRHSVQQIIRPITSRTKLMRTYASTPRDSGSFAAPRENDSIDFSCRGDGFESWDTSAVENGFANPFVAKPMLAKKRLEAIPGSRPVSPAKPLDGPFPGYEDPITPENLPLPDSPMQSPIVLAADSESINSSNPGSPPLRRTSSIREAHVHPLFRSHSPTPPPTPSADTIITASPFAGQVVHGDHAIAPRRMQSRAGSRPSSPHSFAANRSGSFPSTRRPSNLSSRHPLDLEPEDIPEMPKL